MGLLKIMLKGIENIMETILKLIDNSIARKNAERNETGLIGEKEGRKNKIIGEREIVPYFRLGGM